MINENYYVLANFKGYRYKLKYNRHLSPWGAGGSLKGGSFSGDLCVEEGSGEAHLSA
jgi:hypothetical protein